MQAILNILSQVNNWICQICSTIVTVSLAAISAILFAAVTSRYFFNNPITWAGDATCLS